VDGFNSPLQLGLTGIYISHYVVFSSMQLLRYDVLNCLCVTKFKETYVCCVHYVTCQGGSVFTVTRMRVGPSAAVIAIPVAGGGGGESASLFSSLGGSSVSGEEVGARHSKVKNAYSYTSY
jgi:hypothetical protein